ncbi:hypothetical protein [Paucibacter sp. DJ2R-2]|uniref:hypothetical protein n=1 Tax=Paucibacter sp. DJ2R-2 TaxID=2893558 RepID=UPI0021E39907|nr:hypothetical protein [Paucibacter sp. DJ2R-2]MCV2419419.1 hypothetical protein [Paucibacter sp. DJ4R-1]MCV2437677.1 hypothetical protein [Paucibacter sp. DJ2R-2]
MLLKLIMLLFGLAAIALGVRSILKQEAKLRGSEDGDDHRVVEGLPAVLVGALEVAIGIYIVVYQRYPSLF